MRIFLLLLVNLLCLDNGAAFGLDLSKAAIRIPPGSPKLQQKAAVMLREEILKRTDLQLLQVQNWGDSSVQIALCTEAQLKEFAPFAFESFSQHQKTHAPEGFTIFTLKRDTSIVILIVGNDPRGVIFGVGRLLRELRMGKGKLELADNFEISTAPKYPLRGHQLGYRPKTNSYDAWDINRWEQYYRDLVIFGCNAIELIPPRSDDDADSPHFPRPPMEMMIEMSRLADDYGLDVWIWYPAMDKDYADPATLEFALKEWANVFSKLPRIDAVFVPGGDPGHTMPRALMNLLAKQTENLRRYHPKAQMWVSPQSFTREWTDQFLDILNNEKPAWLSGVVFGPQVRLKLSDLRAAVPAQYPIRHYPDITHSRQCQYPVPNWDVAYAVTEARECINPRPIQEAIIFAQTQPYTIGFLTYSEGCNDDVNKAVWSALGWNPEERIPEILRQFSGYFIGDEFRDDFANGLSALEENWKGPLLSNESVYVTLQKFQAMEGRALPTLLKNWRFQQALFRAYYDAYTRARLIHETAAEERALEILRAASKTTALKAIRDAEAILDDAARHHPALDWRQPVFDLAEALYQSIRMQLSVSKYKAIAIDRGACLDTIDYPLNNRLWLKERFAEIVRLQSESERLASLDRVINWTNPGPGGFYDDLGNIKLQPHFITGLGFDRDAGAMESARIGFEEDLAVDEPEDNPGKARRVSWIDHAESLFDAPLQMHYENLDPAAHYKLRITYAGDSPKRKILLLANNKIEIHPLIQKPFPFRPIEFAVPPEATKTGTLDLSWFREAGLGGNGRGCQVSEVWLIKESNSSYISKISLDRSN
jgi:hypothetical protein